MECHICKRKTESFAVERKRWRRVYHRCPHCEYIFMDEGDLLTGEEELKRYSEHNNSVEDEGYRNYFRRFVEYALEGVDKNAHILDYGSGPEPVLASVLAEEGYNNVDIYDKYFTQGDLPGDKGYDVITSTEVVEHIYRPMEVFGELAEKLIPGGRLIVMTAFHNNNIEEFSRWWYINDPTHVVFYSVKTMRYIGERYGLEWVMDNGSNIVIFRKGKNEKI